MLFIIIIILPPTLLLNHSACEQYAELHRFDFCGNRKNKEQKRKTKMRKQFVNNVVKFCLFLKKSLRACFQEGGTSIFFFFHFFKEKSLKFSFISGG